MAIISNQHTTLAQLTSCDGNATATVATIIQRLPNGVM